MERNASAGVGRLGIFIAGAVFIGFAAFFLSPAVRADDQIENKKIAELISFQHKFLGSTSCKSCHGDAAADPGAPPKKGSEFTVWSTLDKHHESYATLSSERSKAIATKGGYGVAENSPTCLACHALNVPAALQGPDFKVAEGNTCDSCHGPAELWSGSDGSPHKDKGWAQKRRDADSFDAVAQAKVDGFWDVRVPKLRAENCASCHLAIDASMVAAGHPQPAFEINEYASQEPRHWTDKRGDQYYAQLWAAGQVVCARDAMTELAKRCGNNVTADLIKDSYDQAMAHATMFQILVDTDGGVGSEVKDDVDKNMAILKDSGGSDAAKIKPAAEAMALQAGKVFDADVKDFAPDATAAGALLAKVLDQADAMGKSYGRRGAEQAAYAARWLYLSKSWDSDAKKEFPDDLTAEYKGFFDNRAMPLGDDAAKFTDAIAKIKANP